MKHLTNYKLLESESNSEIISDIKDMLLDLTDELFNVDCEMFNDNGIEIRVGRNAEFKWEDISDVMTRLNNYLISTGSEATINYVDDRLETVIITNNKEYQGKKYQNKRHAGGREKSILKLDNNTLRDHFTDYYVSKYHQFTIYIDFDISETLRDIVTFN